MMCDPTPPGRRRQCANDPHLDVPGWTNRPSAKSRWLPHVVNTHTPAGKSAQPRHGRGRRASLALPVPMCGIAGLYSKQPSVAEHLGAHLAEMLGQLSERGPDSVGVAIYRHPAPPGARKLTLHAGGAVDWDEVAADLPHLQLARARPACAAADRVLHRGDRGAAGGPRRCGGARRQRREHDRDLQGGRRGVRVLERFGLREVRGSHATRTHPHGDREPGHDRALASVLDRPRPVPGPQRLALQPQPPARASCARGHSLPDRQRQRGRRRLPDVAACARAQASRRRWRAASRDLDGFYTFAVGTVDGFAVLRDPIACKPAVMAETDDWVAMASEYRAIAMLPGAEDATIWEPEPGRVYSWGTARAGVSERRPPSRPRPSTWRPSRPARSTARVQRRPARRRDAGRARPATRGGEHSHRGRAATRRRGRDRGARRLLLRGHEQAGDGARSTGTPASASPRT